MSINEQGELLELFENFKAKCAEPNTQIKATDEHINTAVYKLYNLNDDEIKIIKTARNSKFGIPILLSFWGLI